MSARHLFFRTRPAVDVWLLLAAAVVCLVVGLGASGSGEGVALAKLGLIVAAVVFLLVAALRHADRLTTPETLAEDSMAGRIGSEPQTSSIVAKTKR